MSTSVISSWLTVTTYPFLRCQWILCLLRRLFSFLYHWQELYQTWSRLTWWVSNKKNRNYFSLLTLGEHLGLSCGSSCSSFQFPVLHFGFYLPFVLVIVNLVILIKNYIKVQGKYFWISSINLHLLHFQPFPTYYMWYKFKFRIC